jgi:TPR repeat protein
MPYKRKPFHFPILLAVVLTFSLLSGCATAPEERPQDPESLMKEAHKAYAAEDYSRVFELVFPLAASGDADAQYTLGYLYFHGLGTQKSEAQAMNWIQRAAAQGHAKALQALK